MVHKPSICTISLGRCTAGHTLEHKLDVASAHGFRGIELFHEDLLSLTTSLPGGATPENQLLAATNIRHLCQKRGLTIVCLQPFMHYEGLLDRDLHAQRITEMHLWVKLAHNLGTDLILLPSSTLPEEQITDDMDLMVRDFQQVADIGLSARPVVRYAFEALCWGTRVDTWESSWDVVQRVNRSNFGVCLDAFNIAGRIYADPTAASGRARDCNQAVLASIARMLSQVDVSRIFLLQVADAERLSSPLTREHEFYNAEQPARMSWSRNARLFYGEEERGAYLPVRAILSAIVTELGYDGWLSFEVFSRAFFDKDESVPEVMAQRAMNSWVKMVEDLGLKTESRIERVQPML
ncbi:hypothetical protein QQS21_009915 [Conoideocrella luteorostrata]|uniref:Xylose isomerase-like TIM barrel domain-containing protein n=1 Tax=Conoideocrella luteorostrata TaxID=1105319 RepID=A0AAJ0CG66_9HYPO|nr:hypothetical protein QQS21_009915 [Conoideocrella luteorostrata]